jgi:hypothetical protein
MKRAGVAAVEVQVVFLLAVAGLRLSGHLPAGDATAVDERCG